MSNEALQPPATPLKRRRIWLFRFLALVLAGVVLELLLQVATLASPFLYWKLQPGGAPIMLPDKILGHVPNPCYLGHDPWGYRNPAVPRQAPIVILGDSQTYGTGVEPEQAWPRVLAQENGMETYSIAFGGWGPTHHLILWDRAATLRPETVIVAFYAGNDLYDSYNLVYNRGQLPELRSTNAAVRKAIADAEREAPYAEQITREFRLAVTGVRDANARESRSRAAVKWLARTVRMLGLAYNVLRAGRNHWRSPRVDSWEDVLRRCEGGAPRRFPVASGSARTVLTPVYRRLALNLGDPRVREGQRIALDSLIRLHRQARDSGAAFLVVFIPTKELVFKPMVADVEDLPQAYRELVGFEETLWKNTRSLLEKKGIPWVDALPALRRSVEQGRAPYPMDWDGHPASSGHRVIARVVLEKLRKLDRVPSPR